jgi:predicted transcriptional regulator
MQKHTSVFDVLPDEAAEARAEADVKAGRVVAHERVREWLLRLVKGEKTPPPSA